MKILLSVVLLAALISTGCADDLKPLNLKFMLRGYCYAGSRPDKQAFGGYGPSDNAPKRITTKLSSTRSLALLALPDESVPFGKSYRGFRLLLMNGTTSEVSLPASDSRLPIIQEALDSKGEWRPIEYLPESWCGNSSHRVFLPARHYWQFAAPAYTGKQRIRLRFVLQQQPPIFSNEIEGSINPAQFKKKRGHTPTDLMDPYSE
jgi:hypothetical protein